MTISAFLEKEKILEWLETAYEEECRARDWNEKDRQKVFAIWEGGACYALMGTIGAVKAGWFDWTGEGD